MARSCNWRPTASDAKTDFTRNRPLTDSLFSTPAITPPGGLHPDGPRLLADVGGTNARFALERGPGQVDSIQVLRCADHAQFCNAVDAYLEQAGRPPVRHAAVAIATPVQGDAIQMTNHHWQFSIEATRRTLGFATLLVVNDFTALSMALPHLDPSHRQQVGAGQSRPDNAIGLVGAGTGLGVGGLIPAGGRWIPLKSEGGHVSFSPLDEREVFILQHCWKRYEHVSAERLVSGPGIELIYQALVVRNGVAPDDTASTPDILRRALEEADPLCLEVVDCFCGMLGTVASNVAVTLGALGGVYIGGGVVPRLGAFFARSSFRNRFESKGRFGAYPAFVGVATILSEHLAQSPTAVT
jgi:glucokinase